MKKAAGISCLFLDVGGVLLTNGWDHLARKRAAAHFKLSWPEMDSRHRLNFETHEEDKITFDQYLDRVVFFEKRPFTRAQFRNFVFAQSKPFPRMIELAAQLKARYGLRVTVVSNESRAVNAHRISRFKLNELADCFVSSCFVHLRKPDADIFRLALDLSVTPPHQVVYIEDTPLFVQVAESLGIRSILHTDFETTRRKLASLGLETDD